MKVAETAISGVLVLEIEPLADDRGFFARTWDRSALAVRGLTADLDQVSIGYNEAAGTLRGLHVQAPPGEEAKTVRCTAGAIYDVAVDLRDGSPTRLSWVGVELTAINRRSLYVPEGCAHGYITLADRTEVLYQISVPYRAELARGYRWDDPAFGIAWPVPIRRLSARDASLPYTPAAGAQ